MLLPITLVSVRLACKKDGGDESEETPLGEIRQQNIAILTNARDGGLYANESGALIWNPSSAIRTSNGRISINFEY